ncbi:hypothetical protein HMPREF1989_00151 [Porphyromonas gingivalis F0566]|uniref:hypothetical protein n=1 Tax=Porphyromonas gingivalis TaxID=837 RepID=UPI0003AD190D|nr:hypothetical protein [Porphyromonas gingivalis]ERJ88921.1 hypothetical protein HMPREF1989_00151 [Porphyromonas gingivalis F0566]
MTKGLRTEIEHIIIKYPKDLNIMCRLRKTAVFEFFVSKLIGLDLAKIKEMTSGEIEEFNKKLSDYSMTRYMKLLYFLCLVDAGEEKEGGEGETKSGEKLLSIFDNFVAYRNGPIEEDIFLNRQNEGEFTHFIFEEGCLKLRQKSDLSLLPEMVENTDQEAVDKALEELEKCQIGKTCREKSVLQQTDTVLVDLSHELSQDVWPAAYYYSKAGGKMSTILLGQDGVRQNEVKTFYEKTTKHPAAMQPTLQ